MQAPLVARNAVVIVHARHELSIDFSAVGPAAVVMLKKADLCINGVVCKQSGMAHADGILHQHTHNAAAVDIAVFRNIGIQRDGTLRCRHEASGIGTAQELLIHGALICIDTDQGHIRDTAHQVPYAIAHQAAQTEHSVVGPKLQPPGDGAVFNGAVHAVACNGTGQTGLCRLDTPMDVYQIQVLNSRILQRREQAAVNGVIFFLIAVQGCYNFRSRLGQGQVQNTVVISVQCAGKCERNPGLSFHIQVFCQNITFFRSLGYGKQIFYRMNFHR